MDPVVFDTGEATFLQDVIEASRTTPILVDFWADWCGPCKVLGPILEQLARDTGGAFRVAKVDTEREPRLAAQFRVQSIPFVVAFVAGAPVDAFVGALDEPRIRAFLQRIGVDLTARKDDAPEEPAPDTPLSGASAILRSRDESQLERARECLDEIEEDDDDWTRAQRLADALPFFRGELDVAGAGAAAARAAYDRWRGGDVVAAMEGLLESVGAQRQWHGELARKALVALMQLHEDEHAERVAALRRRLAVMLY